MEAKIKRRKYFIHPSSQIKYIAMSILPALIMSIFCTYFLIESGELILQIEKDKLNVEFAALNHTVSEIEKESSLTGMFSKLRQLKYDLMYLENVLKMSYFDTIKKWNETKLLIFDILLVVLVFVGFFSLLYSHRIAGPLFRLKRYMDMLADGKDVPPIKFRSYDEFKELAESLNRIREKLKSEGKLHR